MLGISVFRADITPPVGHPLCAGWYPSSTGISERLSANGIILHPANEPPIVLCALDWAELSNGEYDLWCSRLAEAAGTRRDRVTVHCIHAHDSPWPDRDAQAILDEAGYPEIIMHRKWCDEALNAVGEAVRQSAAKMQEVTDVKTGKAKIEGIASNRRVMGPDGKVKGVRWTRCRDAALRAEPEGLIDPYLKTISFWSGDKKVVSLHYYAVHPTSYDGTGIVTTDFVGIARERLAEKEGIPHIYFTECAGNITPGKYNDGVVDNRELFTGKVFDAMVESERDAKSIGSTDVKWKTALIQIPPRDDQPVDELTERINCPETKKELRSRAALMLAFRRRFEARAPIIISALHLGDKAVAVHTPGESFMEYQIFAQDLCPGKMAVVPSYGDCGPGYITLAKSFEEGGYEPVDSFCSGETERILRDAIRQVVAT